MRRRTAADGGSATPVRLIAAGLGGWLLATVATQHPHRSFDGLRRFDPLGLILPNWRFFAPEPAQHDYHVLYRTLGHDDVPSPWVEASEIAPRTWLQTLYFPDRRREKGMFDVASEIITLLEDAQIDLSTTAPFELLRDHVELRIRAQDGPLPQGFQFLLARDTGFDHEGEPDYILASPFIELAR
jgi:hypothetical protein